jgi:hypothetical protein
MIHVDVVGPDGPHARMLTESAQTAVVQLGVKGCVHFASEDEERAQYPPLTGPGLFIDGVLVASGSYLTTDDVCSLIRWRHPELGEPT